mmetsp:Transcript_9754/g.27673  ORF Transcript_9754/g.27673 Transcript_9754/m.27673 type:complete len:200 (-) Transcript_9754:188-787(-)|eukprot:CAMPEP_0119561624 /NCGR_PEP_ID=MMETSP1352-20130426/18178_1 /TAXON_ID=265584 /ORGANISM="Stauroneis constricta, Strain CCMP1120" /LENGTH=199 /DNA_ID=CAMNT_0007609867 /DNA_START=38 /DNA_END=637 /DNA_ORIENTATION=+
MSNNWPPQTLLVNTEGIINECESLEVTPEYAERSVLVPAIAMAAFLVTGEYVYARHLWRRWKQNCPSDDEAQALTDWWRVGRAMMESKPETIWHSLARIQQEHPAPLNHYATEVGDAYRRRVILKYPKTAMRSQPFLRLMNFSTAEQVQQFIAQNQEALAEQAANQNKASQISSIIGMLETTPVSFPKFDGSSIIDLTI